MTLSDIATVSGKGGLYKVLAPTKSGVILESMDESKTKMIATSNHKLSLLNEISIYTTTKEGTVALLDVLKKIEEEYGDDPGVDINSDSTELKSFLKSILPEFDDARVYVSDIKKLVRWYEILRKEAPEVFKTEAKQEKEKEKENEKAEEVKSDEPVSDEKEAPKKQRKK